MEDNQKLDSMLNLAVDVSEEDREESRELGVGYNIQEKTWRLIVKYTGDLTEIEEAVPGSRAIPLYNQYGIIQIPADQIDVLASLPQIQFIEKPKQLYFSLDTVRSISCVNSVQAVPGEESNGGGGSSLRKNLTGKGVLVGIVDSGIDYTHPAFRNPDGSTRILYLWDQTGRVTDSLKRPEGYSQGAEFTQEDINRLLAGEDTEGLYAPEETGTGHGTAVAGIAAGNGSASAGRRYRGIAVESDLLVVKLAAPSGGFPRTTEVMEGLDYLIRKGVRLQRPIAVNLSFGNNYGAHNGQSLFENYIAQLSGIGKNVIVVASGNEGDARHHARIQLQEQMETVPFAIAENEVNISLQLWKRYADDFALFLEAPNGVRQQIDPRPGNSEEYSLAGNRLLVYYGEPTPYAVIQEIYMEWLPGGERQFLTEGVWKILLLPERIVDGRVELWLPTIEAVGMSTGFLRPSPDTTLTIPSTSRNVVTVGAYRQSNDTVAAFSGRGDTVDGRNMPTLVAPGVGVVTAAPGGGYTARTGTSMAAPAVTGSAALMMEWGIVQGNDPYLYGEKIKAYLIRGARPLPGERVPSVRQGWGALCLRDSLP